MSEFDVALIGTGEDPEDPSVEGFAMAYRHADAYETIEDCEVVACADIVPENARAFADAYGIGEDGVFTDYGEMITAVEPDVVSVTVPPAIHADIVVDVIHSGVVDAVHCEKPMDLTYGGARLMAQEASRWDVQLTFNHQRRFGAPFRNAKELIDGDEIGDLRRIEVCWGDLFDTGSHAVDLCGYLNDEHAAEWVIGALDYRTEDVRFGVHQENQAFVQWEYENGVHGLLSTGPGSGLTDAAFHLRGTDGEIKVIPEGDAELVVRTAESGGWEAIDCGGDGLHGPNYHERSIADVVGALREGRASELRAGNAINTAEILFGAYESVRKRGRVDTPLGIDDNPFEAMIEAGDLDPRPADEA